MKKRNRKRHVPTARPVTIADRLLATGQRLRATETIVAATLALRFAAQHVQAGAR